MTICKECPKCKQIIPLDDFAKDKGKKYGVASYCKSCQRMNKKKWYDANRQHAIDYTTKWVKEHYEHVLAHHRQWRKENRVLADRYNSNWKHNHRATHLASRRRRYEAQAIQRRAEIHKWRLKNPDKVRIQSKVRQARMRSSTGNHNPDDIRRLYDEQDGRCAYCGITLYDSFHVDHKNPVSRGGSNSPDNLAITCATCNLNKKDKTVAEWQQARGW